MVDSIECGEVDLDIGLGIEHEPLHRIWIAVHGHGGTLPKILGVGEEQRRVVAVDQQPGLQSGVRIILDIVHARHSGNEAQHAVVRASHPAQQIKYRQSDRGQNAVKHPERQHRRCGEHGEDQLATAKFRQPPKARQIDQPHSGVDHQGTKSSRRETGQ